MVLASVVRREFRTTAHPELLDDGALVRMGESLSRAGATMYAVQICRGGGHGAARLARVAADYPRQETLQPLRGLFETFTLRRD